MFTFWLVYDIETRKILESYKSYAEAFKRADKLDEGTPGKYKYAVRQARQSNYKRGKDE